MGALESALAFSSHAEKSARIEFCRSQFPFFTGARRVPVLRGGAVARAVSKAQRDHILYGDAKSGGHRAGTGRPGKTEFPIDWSNDKIIAEIESVANDPASMVVVRPDRRVEFSGHRDGMDILVVGERDGVGIVTGYPTNVPINP